MHLVQQIGMCIVHAEECGKRPLNIGGVKEIHQFFFNLFVGCNDRARVSCTGEHKNGFRVWIKLSGFIIADEFTVAADKKYIVVLAR